MKKILKSIGTHTLLCALSFASVGVIYAAWNDPVNSGDTFTVQKWTDLVDHVATLGSGSGKFISGTDTSDAVFTGGNVGVGVLDPAQGLHVAGGIRQEFSDADKYGFISSAQNNHMTQNAYWDETNGWRAIGSATTGNAVSVQTSLDQNIALRVGIDNSGTLTTDDAVSFDYNSFNITQDGNIGIGTQVPDEKLVVEGNIKANDPTLDEHVATKGYVDSQKNASSEMYDAGIVAANTTQAQERVVATFVMNDYHWTHSVGFFVEASARYYSSGYKKYYIESGSGSFEVRLVDSRGDSAHRFGLRIAKEEVLSTTGTSPVTYNNVYRVYAQSDYYMNWDVSVGTTGMEISLDEEPSIQGILGVHSDTLHSDISTLSKGQKASSFEGYVGIGTDTPLTNLHVVGGSIVTESSGYPTFYAKNSSKLDGTYGKTWGWMNHAGGFHLYAYASNSTNIAPGAPLRGIFIQDTTANVAIGGGHIPSEKLDVSGNIRATGLIGTGNAYVCVNANGVMYRSSSACN